MEFIDLKKQYQINKEVIDAAVAEVMASGRYIHGRQVVELEERLAAHVGVGQAVGLSSGTDALMAAFMSLGLKPGDEVICPAFTFIAPAEAVALLGGRPVLVDVEPVCGTIDPAAAAAAITSRTVGLVAVDLFGQCSRLEEIEALAGRHGLWVVEDAAQSFGAERLNRKACSFGQIGVTSFFPAKPLGAMGDAGMAFTDDEQLAEKMRALRDHGQAGRYRHLHLGFNGRLDTLQAAVLLAKFSFFEAELISRRAAAEIYGRTLAGLSPVELPRLLEGNTSTWAQYTIKCPDREGLAAHLRDRGVPTAVHYPRPLHRQPVFEGLALAAGDLPVAEDLSRRVLSLPMHPYLEPAEQALVVEAVAGYFAASAWREAERASL